METHGNSSRMEFEIYHLYKKNIWREKVETRRIKRTEEKSRIGDDFSFFFER